MSGTVPQNNATALQQKIEGFELGIPDAPDQQSEILERSTSHPKVSLESLQE